MRVFDTVWTKFYRDQNEHSNKMSGGKKKATELRKKEFDDETPGLNCTASLLTCCDLISIC